MPVVYTVVASKPALHIYQIRDREGNEHVVHQNLLLQVNFLPLDEALGGDAAPVSLPASNMTNAPPTSYWHVPEMSGLETAAATVEPSLAGSFSSVDDWDEVCTTSWVNKQSSTNESPGSDCPPPPSVAASPPSDGPATAVAPLQPTSAHSNPLHASNADSQLTSWYGRIIRPVCHLIESVAQLESIHGVEPSPHSVIHV